MNKNEFIEEAMMFLKLEDKNHELSPADRLCIAERVWARDKEFIKEQDRIDYAYGDNLEA